MKNEEKVNILVVDDLPEKLLVIETILEELGENIVTARSGREALRYLLDQEFAVILLDVYMPDIDGLETAALIRSRKQTAHTPVIFITALNDDVHTARGYSLGAVDYIFSPVVPEILRTKVGVFVDLFKKTRQVERQAEERIALVRAQAARAVAEKATRRSTFLAEASTSLNQSLDYDQTVRALAHVLVPALGDFAAVSLIEDAHAHRETVAALVEPGDAARVISVNGDVDLDPDLSAAIRHVLEVGEPETHAEFLGSPQGRRLLLRSPYRAFSWMVVPLEGRARPLGTLTLARSDPKRAFSSEDLKLVEDLASRASVALANARLYRAIQEDDRRKNEFLAMLAHELRNPLAPIRNAVEILRRIDREDDELDWVSDVIGRQVDHMVRLVDDLLDVSRITRGKIQLRKESVDVATVVSQAVETSRPLMETRGQTLRVDPPAEPIWVNGDRARLAQVLSNVLNNAAKYTGDGGRIQLSTAREGAHAVFRIRDSGIGIPPAMLSRIFDLFTQVDRSLDRSQGGLGIGLTVVKRLMEMHGGRVEARSDGLGRGSEFILRLPVASANGHHQGAGPAATREAAEAGRCTACRILTVDDNLDSGERSSGCCGSSGHEVRTAPDGPAALEMMETDRPDVVLLDIGLPGMDGYEVARRIRTP